MATERIGGRWAGLPVSVFVVAALIAWLSASLSAETSPRNHQYPTAKTVRFTSWSLFLVCDPAWLRSEGEADLIRLYNAYLDLATTSDENDAPLSALGATTGWRADEIDPLKSKPYCDSLRLTSRAGPFLVITVHPPDTLVPSDAKVLLGFGNRRASAIAKSVGALAQQLSAEGISETHAGSQQWWSAWKRVSRWLRARFPGVTMSVQSNIESKR